MGSLKNLYISQSYQGLLHLASNSTASATLEGIEDGLGNSLGLYLNNAGDLRTDTSVSSSTIEATNLVIKNKIELTGSIDIDGPVTASSAFIENDLIVSGTLFSSKVVTLIESSSIIYSSGSNILGDEVTDTQTLIGTVIISGSQSLTGSAYITGEVSSSTVAGIGNVTDFSTSVDSRLDIVEATASLYVPFSQSVDNRLDEVEATSSFLNTTFSQSVDSRLDELENFTASTYINFSTSVDSRLDGVEATASYLNTTFSQSVDLRLDQLESWSSSLQTNFVTETELTATASLLQNQINTKLNTSSFNAYTQSANQRLSSIEAITSSFVTNGPNNFVGNQVITGSLIISSSAAVDLTTIGNSVFSGSVNGAVIPLTVFANTASMDCSLGNFFDLVLPSTNTSISASNINPGQTITLRITQNATPVTVTYASNMKFPIGQGYIASSVSGAVDVITFVSFDSLSLLSVATNRMV